MFIRQSQFFEFVDFLFELRKLIGTVYGVCICLYMVIFEVSEKAIREECGLFIFLV